MIGVSLVGIAIFDSVGRRGVGEGSHRRTGFDAFSLLGLVALDAPSKREHSPWFSFGTAAPRGLFLVGFPAVGAARSLGASSVLLRRGDFRALGAVDFDNDITPLIGIVSMIICSLTSGFVAVCPRCVVLLLAASSVFGRFDFRADSKSSSSAKSAATATGFRCKLPKDLSSVNVSGHKPTGQALALSTSLLVAHAKKSLRHWSRHESGYEWLIE